MLKEKFSKKFFTNLLFWVLPGSMLLVALMLFRLRMITGMRVDFARARSIGFDMGVFLDAVSVLAVYALALIINGVFRTRLIRRLAWPILGISLGITTAGNSEYAIFFGHPMPLSAVFYSTGDLFGATASFFYTLSQPFNLCGFAILAGAALIAFFNPQYSCSSQPARKRRIFSAGIGVALMILALVVQQVPRWLRIPYHDQSVFASSTVFQWTKQSLGTEANTGTRIGRAPSHEDIGKARQTIRRYRDHNNHGEISEPLQYYLEGGAERKATRAALGLPLEGRVHVILLFLESARYFELNHPEIGKDIFPRLRQLIGKHGIHFTQAYSPGVNTDEGQFTSLCAFLPNLGGGTIYHVAKTLGLRCLPQALMESNYATTLMSGLPQQYGGMDVFAVFHGTKKLFSEDYFGAHGATSKVGRWGLDDGPVLQETLKIFHEYARKDQPFYGTVMTISTHHPWSVVPEGPLTPEVIQHTKSAPEYQGYLSRFRYLDNVAGEFIEKLFDMPEGERTLVVLLGDQVFSLKPTYPLSTIAEADLPFRIPLVFMTKNMPHPRRDDRLANQMDIAPTVAAVAGYSGKVSWLGSNLMTQKKGTPFVYSAGNRIFYRTDTRACYTVPDKSTPLCVQLNKGDDPIFTDSLKIVPSDPAEDLLFNDTVKAVNLLIQSNQIE